MRWLVLPLLLFVLSFAAFAQEPEGTLTGTLTLTDGTPCASTNMRVSFGNRVIHGFSTGEDGSFAVVLPAGAGTIEAPGIKEPVIITPGETTEVELVLALDRGMIVNLLYVDQTPANENIRAAYRSPGGHKDDVFAVRIGKGKHWFPEVPENATELSVIASLSWQLWQSCSITVRRQWTFTDAVPLRTLEMTLPNKPPVKITVLDSNGQPITEKRLRFDLTHPYPSYSNYWGEWKVAERQLSQWNFLTTDANGVLDFSFMPPQTYTLSLRDGDLIGPNVSLVVGEDGTVTPTTYKLVSTLRRVVQTVFTPVKQPAANAEVTASYCWDGKAIFKKATADAAGIVVWDRLPPVRVIVSGPEIAPGVIPPDATEVTRQLPAPVVDNQPVEIRFVLDTPIAETQGFMSSEDRSDARTLDDGAWWTNQLKPGAPFSVFLMMHTSPPKMASITNAYLPYVDGGNREYVISDFTFEDSSEAHITFVSADNTPVPGVSRLQLLPVEIAAGYQRLLAIPNLPAWLRQEPVENTDGTVTILMVCPGTYRLLLDLFDENAPVNPDLQFTVKPGINEITIHLPKPLAMAPGGATVNWITRVAPTKPHTLHTHAYADTVPVFGSAQALQACWYQANPNTLMLWDGAKGGAWQKIPLRSLLFYPRNQPYSSTQGSYYYLYPVVPEGAPTASSLDTRGLPAGSTPFELDKRYHLDLWETQYLIGHNGGGNIYGTLRPTGGFVSERYANEPIWPCPQYGYLVDLRLPDGMTIPKATGEFVRFAFDEPSEIRTGLLNSNSGKIRVMIPHQAKIFTVIWPGIGIVRDMRFPKMDYNTPDPVLPAFQALATVTGTLHGEDAAGTELLFSDDDPQGSLQMCVTVDAQGKFTLKNVMPGKLFVTATNRPMGGTWMITVPEQGELALTLKTDPKPCRLFLPWAAYAGTAWWLPENGAPMRLPNPSSMYVPDSLRAAGHRWTQISAYDLPEGKGMLWVNDPRTGEVYTATGTLAAGTDVTFATDETPTPLGIACPLSEKYGLPGTLTLIGEGQRAGVRMVFPNVKWHVASALGQAFAQIDSVPPGDYRVQVETGGGILEGRVTIGAAGGAVQLVAP